MGDCAKMGAALVLAGGVPAVHAAGIDHIRIGLIGCGGRGVGAAMNALEAHPGARVVTVGDVFADRAEGARQNLTRQRPNQADVPRERCFVGFDAYAKVIASEIDLALLATPPGFRPLHFEAAVSAGKHVFMEKPVSVDSPGSRAIIAASKIASQKKLKVVVGYQRRHDARYIEAVRQLRDGKPGKIQRLEACWKTGSIWSRPRQAGATEMQYQLTNWIHFVWLSGDMIVEVHTHNLDVCNWAMGTHPAKVSGTGGQKQAKNDVGDTFDHFLLEYTYPDGTVLASECGYIFAAGGKVGEWVSLQQGVIPLINAAQGAPVGGNPYIQEWKDLFAAINDNSDMNEAASAAETSLTAIMGRMAAYRGKEVLWQDALASGESFLPTRCAMDADPPALPDKAGRYPVPARGRNRLYASI